MWRPSNAGLARRLALYSAEATRQARWGEGGPFAFRRAVDSTCVPDGVREEGLRGASSRRATANGPANGGSARTAEAERGHVPARARVPEAHAAGRSLNTLWRHRDRSTEEASVAFERPERSGAMCPPGPTFQMPRVGA